MQILTWVLPQFPQITLSMAERRREIESGGPIFTSEFGWIKALPCPKIWGDFLTKHIEIVVAIPSLLPITLQQGNSCGFSAPALDAFHFFVAGFQAIERFNTCNLIRDHEQIIKSTSKITINLPKHMQRFPDFARQKKTRIDDPHPVT